MENTTLPTNSDNNITENESEINEKIVQNAIEKLDAEAESVSGQNVPAIGIYHFVRAKAISDETFAQQVLQKKLSDCFSFVMEQYREQALNMAKGTGTRDNPEVVGIGASSDEIFGYLVDFYTLSDEELKQRAEEKAAARKAKAEAEKKERQEKAKADAEAKANAKKKADAEKKKKEKDKKKADEMAEQGQLSFM